MSKAKHPSLRRSVVRPNQSTNLSRDRRNIHNSSPLLLSHSGQKSLSHQNCRLQIHVNHLVPARFSNVLNLLWTNHSGVVDQNIHCSELSIHAFRHLLHLIRRRNIRLHGNCATPAFMNLSISFLRFFTARAKVNRHITPCTSQGKRYRGTNPTIATRHQRNFSGQWIHSHILYSASQCSVSLPNYRSAKRTANGLTKDSGAWKKYWAAAVCSRRKLYCPPRKIFPTLTTILRMPLKNCFSVSAVICT